MAVDGADANACLARDVVDLRLGTAGGEHGPGALENALTIAPRIRALRTVDIDDAFGHGMFTRVA